MAKTPSTMLELGTKAPEFNLRNVDGSFVSRMSLSGKPLLVMFISNHCPFVKHLREKLSEIGNHYLAKGIAVVAIGSNDPKDYPEDGPEKMKVEVLEAGYQFPYLFDASQEVAKAYHAACTPDFFLFDPLHRLVYRGQFDDSRPGNGVEVTGKDLIAAMDAVLIGKKPNENQKPSLGCNIKWKKGNEPSYY